MGGSGAYFCLLIGFVGGTVCPNGGPDCGTRQCCVDGDTGNHFCCGGGGTIVYETSPGLFNMNWTPLIIGLVISIVVSIVLSVLCCLFCNGCFLHRWRNPDRYETETDGFSMFPFGVFVSPMHWSRRGEHGAPPSYSTPSPQPHYYEEQNSPGSTYHFPSSSLQRNRVHFSDEETSVKTIEPPPRGVLKK